MHCIKSFSIFPRPLGGNNDVIYKLFPPRETLVSDIPAGDGNIEKLFLQCGWLVADKAIQGIVTRKQLPHTRSSVGSHCYGKVFISCFLFMRFLLINSRGDCGSKSRTSSRAKPISWRP
jgi:hypothetical protein